MESRDVLDTAKVAASHVLVPHHPGKVVDTHPSHHLKVTWLGLEDEPASFGVGHNPDIHGIYRFLGVPNDDEWDEAVANHWWQQED